MVTLSSVTESYYDVKRFAAICPIRAAESPEWPVRIGCGEWSRCPLGGRVGGRTATIEDAAATLGDHP